MNKKNEKNFENALKRLEQISDLLENEDFYLVTKIVLEKLANNVPIISVLEGVYDMKGLFHGLNSHLKALTEYSNE